MKTFITLLLVAFAIMLSACNKQGTIVTKQWRVSQPLPGQTVSVGYGSIVNNTDTTLQLVAVTNSETDSIELHQHQEREGIMAMRKVELIAIKPDAEFIFTTGGYHLMLFNISPDAQKELLTLTFEFSNHPSIQTQAQWFRR